MISTEEIIKSSHLVFVDPSKPGIYRKGKPGKFRYEKKDGNQIKETSDLDRIKSLVIPPAWTEVWISPKKNGYLQVVGKDVAGRKQYKYHPDWTKRRSNHKYFRLLEFGKVLKQARAQVVKDLRRKEMDERKVLAICVQVMQKTFIRIGNDAYEKAYGSYGLSTLKDKHLKQKGNKWTLSFIGKKGVSQEIELSDKNLAKLVKRCKDIPGQQLFQYYKDGYHYPIDSGMVNTYIKEITGGDFTAKDFRTWGGTLEAMRQLAICSAQNPDMNAKKQIAEALDCVASTLGNTRAVCKSSYVYPALLESFENGDLDKYLKKINLETPKSATAIQSDEKVLMTFLKKVKVES